MIRDFIQDTSERRPAETGPTRSQQGQSIIILAFAFMALLAFMGLALDLGLVYIERVRLKRAVDAATLAGVTELPFESQAYERALEYLDANGYPVDELDIYFTGCWPDFNREGPPDPMFNPTSPYPLNPDAPILPEPPPILPPLERALSWILTLFKTKVFLMINAATELSPFLALPTNYPSPAPCRCV